MIKSGREQKAKVVGEPSEQFKTSSYERVLLSSLEC